MPELERVVVVLGAHAVEVRAAVEFGRAEPVVCDFWSRGQAASLRCGIEVPCRRGQGARDARRRALISSAAIARMVAQPPGARATYDGRPGHPVVLGPEQIGAIARLTGDRGARGLLGDGPEVECGDLCSGRDVDTREDMEALRDEARAGV